MGLMKGSDLSRYLCLQPLAPLVISNCRLWWPQDRVFMLGLRASFGIGLPLTNSRTHTTGQKPPNFIISVLGGSVRARTFKFCQLHSCPGYRGSYLSVLKPLHRWERSIHCNMLSEPFTVLTRSLCFRSGSTTVSRGTGQSSATSLSFVFHMTDCGNRTSSCTTSKAY